MDVPTAGLGDRPFLSRQERPPPKRPPTCWCPLEARASPAPPVRPNQGPDRGEPACEITPLSCSHWARDTLHPCRSSVQPPTHPCLYFTPNVNGSFLEEKKRGEREGYGETRKQLRDGSVLLGLGVQSQQQLYSRPRVTAEAKVEFHPRLVFPRFSLVSLYHLQPRKK